MLELAWYGIYPNNLIGNKITKLQKFRLMIISQWNTITWMILRKLSYMKREFLVGNLKGKILLLEMFALTFCNLKERKTVLVLLQKEAQKSNDNLSYILVRETFLV